MGSGKPLQASRIGLSVTHSWISPIIPFLSITGDNMRAIRFAAIPILVAFFFFAIQPFDEIAFGDASQSPQPTTTSPSPYLFVWAGDEDRKDEDFLAVIDARPSQSSYGEVIATLPVGARATQPHHTEYEWMGRWTHLHHRSWQSCKAKTCRAIHSSSWLRISTQLCEAPERQCPRRISVAGQGLHSDRWARRAGSSRWCCASEQCSCGGN